MSRLIQLSRIILLILCFNCIACDDEQDNNTMSGEVMAGEMMAGEVEAGEVEAGEVEAGEIPQPFDPSSLNGEWDLKIRLVDVGNIEVDFRVVIEASELFKIDRFDMSVLKDGQISEVIASITDIDVAENGDFSLTITEAIILGDFSPTGSDVTVSFTLNAGLGNATSIKSFCGEVTGEVVSLSLPVNMSTFGAIEAGSNNTIPGSCDEESVPAMLPRIENCPAIAPGMNMISSGGYERGFEVILPSNYTDEMSWPLITLWHGFGSSPEEIKSYSNLEDYAESEGFVMVVPSSYPDGAVEWDSLASGDSPDLAFYDDLIYCVTESFSIDQQRIHSTGLSAGGLWTSYLSVFRSEVLASVVGMSAGLIPDYPSDNSSIPHLVAWGGENDIAYEQNFHTLAQDLITNLSANGHFVVSCNHNLEHVWETEFTPWAVRFMLDHPKGINELPYAAGLPDGVYPDYCEVVNAE